MVVSSPITFVPKRATMPTFTPVATDEPERSRALDNLARIKLITFPATLLYSDEAMRRLGRVLENRAAIVGDKPHLLLFAHDDDEFAKAEWFQHTMLNKHPGWVASIEIMRQKGHNDASADAIRYLKRLQPDARMFEIKRQLLVLSRRGGKGIPHFIGPFTGGHGTTCATWTRKVSTDPDGKPLKGFVRAAVAVGFCPVECPFCYLLMVYTQSMDIALNWEDLHDELQKWGYKGAKYRYPINFGETSGMVEYDNWFSAADGEGSMVQYIIDACEEARVIPFFLTKQAYPDYLNYKGMVQVGISLSPEPVREWLSPYGSPAEVLLESLRKAVAKGAISPVIRLAIIWSQRDAYPPLLDKIAEMFKDYKDDGGLRITADIIRFTPSTAAEIGRIYPEQARTLFAEANVPYTDDGDKLRVNTRATTDRKFRPEVEQQTEIYRWLRDELNARGLRGVDLTPCKGNPDELLPLVREGTIEAMPCACYALNPVMAKLVRWQLGS